MSTNPLNDISKVYLEQVVESAVPGKPAERLGAVTAIPKSERDAARERALAKAKAMREKKGITKEALDPVGQEDADVDNDGKKNTKSDKYLLKRRQAISKAITHKEELDPVGKEDKDIDNEFCALLGCGLSTGFSVVNKDANIKFGETVLVIGCGGVGLSCIQAAKLSLASFFSTP